MVQSAKSKSDFKITVSRDDSTKSSANKIVMLLLVGGDDVAASPTDSEEEADLTPRTRTLQYQWQRGTLTGYYYYVDT